MDILVIESVFSHIFMILIFLSQRVYLSKKKDKKGQKRRKYDENDRKRQKKRERK